MRADKAALSTLIRRVADLGVAVILVEHDMALVMGIEHDNSPTGKVDVKSFCFLICVHICDRERS